MYILCYVYAKTMHIYVYVFYFYFYLIFIFILFLFLFYFYFYFVLFFVLFFDDFGCVFSIVLASKPYVVHQYIYVPECWYIVFVCHLTSMIIKIHI